MASLPQTTFEQRSPFYEDVETLIQVGFLTHTFRAHGVTFVLRSLGPGDLFLLQMRAGNEVFGSSWQLWMLATSIWMVNGVNLLTEPHAPVRMFEAVQRFPRPLREILFSLSMGLYTRQNQAINAVEPYCYEATSRFKWKGYNGHAPGRYAGVPGAEHLGLNYVQQMWTAFNDMEDKRVQDQNLWDGFKLVASAAAPKGVQKMEQKEQQMRSAEDERRQAVRDRFYYIQMGVLMPDGKAKEDFSPYITFSKTPDELAEEMHNWVTGKEDHHDKVVSDYKQRVIANYRAEKAAREERQAMLRKRLDEQSDTFGDMERPLVGYTAAQLQEILKNRKPGAPGVKRVFESDRDDRDYLYEKYLESVPDAGMLEGSDGRVEMKPGGRDFTEALQDRDLTFRRGPGEE